ncbi:hypothetical protein OEZ85_005311 [Tetradesmus obliquus]|uniref:Uncharacterized protein n=1 Tax=Tetradesmus obliquus TaxID=3088 RepID=A0ABY8UIU9_TETOB|nr:hypothetical protein OEZ85_005311 [Tetradesmus obliquus]
MPYAPTRIHVVYGTPASITEITPLQLEDLRPANLTKPAMLEFLQSNLTTRAAAQKGVQCMVLSASAYLPSQLDTISSLARGIGISVALCSSAASNHILFMPSLAGLEIDEWRQRIASITHSTCELLAPTFGKMQQLSEERLADARDAEQMLDSQLRLWHAPSWGATLQRELESNRAWRRWMAVRSLMGPPSLAAARKLIEKKGMYMVELQLPLAEILPAAAAAAAEDGEAAAASPSRWWGGGSSSSSRRRSSAKTAAAAAAAAGSVRENDAARPPETVLVIACFPLDEESAKLLLAEAKGDCFSDVLLA